MTTRTAPPVIQLTVRGRAPRSTAKSAQQASGRQRLHPNRRDFLKVLGAGTAGVIGVKSARAAVPRRVSDDWMGMLTDLTLCIGCRKCEWACKDVNGLPNAPIEAYDDTSVLGRRRRTDPENFTVVNRYPPAQPGEKPVDVKRQCMHCNEPACASACLVGAFEKTPTGQVVYNENVCIGCRYCMVACPFSIPTYTYDDPYTPAIRKCTMCFEIVTKQGGVPGCAKICPVEAITFGKRSDLLKLARERIRNHPGRYVDHIYGEHEAGGTCWLYISGRPFEKLGFPDLEATPYPALTQTFLSGVPLVLTLWPALLMGAYVFSKHRQEAAESVPPGAAARKDDDGRDR